VQPYNEEILLAVLELSTIYISTIKGPEVFIPEKLMELAVYLHEVVDELEGRVQNSVILLCELWWKQELEEREHLITNILPIFIQYTLSKTGRRKDVVSLHNLQEALHVIEFNNSLVELLVSSAACQLFLTCDEGLKWLSNLFSWQFLVEKLHRSIKCVLPNCSQNQSAKYGEVYFRAWKKNEGEVRKIIEENCIQDLMYAAIHVDPLIGKLSANLHHLLHYVHRQKRHHLVAQTIYVLYDPFLWRSLKAANGYIRMNATGLLCDAFPLSASTLSHEERAELEDKQYHTIITLLTDPCHLVRITAIKGTCNILNKYWYIIPSHIIKTIFQKLISELLCDASSSEVRNQVIKGLILLLDNNDAVSFLKEVLPRISDSFDDISINVRISFVNLLLKIKSLKILRFWRIIPVNHLLHRLEDDMPAVCKLLTQLLLSYFHPAQREDKELLQRCLALLEENLGAARRFYQYASRTLDLPSTVHFILLIWRTIRNYIFSQHVVNSTTDEVSVDCADGSIERPLPAPGHSTLKRSISNQRPAQSVRSVDTAENKENKSVPCQKTRLTASLKDNKYRKESGLKSSEGDDDENCSVLDNPKIVGGLLDTIVILWSTNSYRLCQPNNLKYLEALRMHISRSMPLLFKIFKDNIEIHQTLLYLSSFLPKTLVPTLVGHCLSRLRSLQQDEDSEDSYVTYVNALCNWNRVDDVLELATEWLVESFGTVEVTSAKERRVAGRSVHFAETYNAQPLLALRLIRHILQHPLNKLAALNKNKALVIELCETLRTVKDLIGERLNHREELSTLCTDTFLCDCWAQYLSLISVLHNPAKDTLVNKLGEEREVEEEEENEADLTFDSCYHIQNCFSWAEKVLLPALSREAGGKRRSRAGEEAIKIAVDALNNLLTTGNHLVIIGAADTAFVIDLCAFTNLILKYGECESFWEVSLHVALEGHQYLHTYGYPSNIDEGTILPVNLVCDCITSIAEIPLDSRSLTKEADSVDKALDMVLTSLGQREQAVQNEVFQHIAATVVDSLCSSVEKMKGVNCEMKTIREIGVGLTLIVGVCQSRVKLSSGFMDALTNFLLESVIDSAALLAVAHFLKVLSLDSGKISKYCLKKAVMAVDSIMPRILFPIEMQDSADLDKSNPDVYESYAKTTKEIVDDLKSTLGII
ncbi:hypothetical protein SK128_008960, partial [Halocaridina rubra]